MKCLNIFTRFKKCQNMVFLQLKFEIIKLLYFNFKSIRCQIFSYGVSFVKYLKTKNKKIAAVLVKCDN